MNLFVERVLERFSVEQLEGMGWVDRPPDRDMRIQLASIDFEFFCRYYLSDHFSLPPAVFQETLMQDAEEMAGRDEETYAMFIVFRGGAKTTVYALGLPLWCLLFNRRHFIVILSDTESMAKDKCLDIKTQLESNPRIDSLLLSCIKAAGDLAQLMNSLGVNPWEKRNKANEHPTATLEITLRDILNKPTPPIDGEYKEV